MDIPFNCIAFFVFLAFVLVLIKKWERSSKAAHRLPPSPWKLPFLGNIHHLIGSPPHHAFRKLAQKYGGLMHLQLGEIPAIVASSPHFAKEIMKTHDLAFVNRPEFQATKIIFYNSADIVNGQYSEYWRQMRKICTLELLSAKMVRSFRSIRQDEALNLISSIRSLAGCGDPINLTEKVNTYTSSMVCRAAFGKVSRDDQKEFLQQIKILLSFSSTLDISDLFPSYKILHPVSRVKANLKKVHSKLDKILENIILHHIDMAAARKELVVGESGYEDLIDVLLRVKESGDLQFPITDDNIKGIVLDLFSAGTETSSRVVEWAMSEMITNPKVMAKAQSELRKALKGKKTIEETDVQDLHYLKLVIKETLRLHPPVPLLVPRESREECEIEGYIIPVKTKVFVNVWAMGRDPEYWDDPESFDPERFEKNSIDFRGNQFEYLPFGGGRRICPGISFGLANIELPLALLLYHFDWYPPKGINSCDLDMTEIIGITSSRKNNLHLRATVYDPSLDKAFQPPETN